MGWAFCEEKHIKKTRKSHKCVFCGRTIPACGFEYLTDEKYCQECGQALKLGGATDGDTSTD